MSWSVYKEFLPRAELTGFVVPRELCYKILTHWGGTITNTSFAVTADCDIDGCVHLWLSACSMRRIIESASDRFPAEFLGNPTYVELWESVRREYMRREEERNRP